MTKATDLDFPAIRRSRAVRIGIARDSMLGFMHLYFPDYITRETAPFQKEIYNLLEDSSVEMLVLMAFRGSGKSTIVSLGFPIWAILGRLQKKYVLITSQTQLQAQQHLKNIRREFEENELLRKDFGPLEESDEWGNLTLVFPKLGARISAASVEQSVRGTRHRSHRPDLVIADDVEDTNSVKTREGRNKVYDWLTGEVIPAGDDDTKFVVVGNLLHQDSLLMRLKNNFEQGTMDGIFRAYPIEKDGKALWLAKYPDKQAIERERKRVGNRVSWLREYYLQIVPDDDQVVKPEWIHYYNELPDFKHLTAIYAGADLAISLKARADYTAIVVAYVYRHVNKLKIYIEANPYCRKVSFPDQRLAIATTYTRIAAVLAPQFYIENQAYQEALVQQMNADGFPVMAFGVSGTDKRARLALVTHKIQDTTIMFPSKGAAELIQQLTGFGVEKHDDLVDAFTMTIIKALATKPIGTYGDLPVNESPSIGPLTQGLFDY